LVARMEQSVIRVSSFTHAVASAAPHQVRSPDGAKRNPGFFIHAHRCLCHATFLDSASLHPGYNSKAHPHAPYFQKRHEGHKSSDIYSLKLRELRAFVVIPLFFAFLAVNFFFKDHLPMRNSRFIKNRADAAKV
jgi:hypothetical protein